MKKNYENLGEQNYFLKSQELKLKKELTFEKNNYEPKENVERFLRRFKAVNYGKKGVVWRQSDFVN